MLALFTFALYILIVCNGVDLRFVEELPPTHCESYNERNISEFQELGYDADSVDISSCDSSFPYCYVVWRNNSGRITLMSKGCFDDPNCKYRRTCVGNDLKNHIVFCCCQGELCNKDFLYEPIATLSSIASDDDLENNHIFLGIKVISILVCCGAAVLFLIIFRFKLNCFKQNPLNVESSDMPSSQVNEKLRPIELLECKAKGRFGAVWKANLKNNIVAVKIVPAEDKQSWFTEQEVFQLPRMDHDNILKFIGAEKHGDSHLAEYWLITAYHELGSLFDFLKENTVTWEQLCIISFTMARGLAHLHEEIPSPRSESCKPSIAHRDFKSKNVLLKNDLSACIADFGLALVFRSQTCGTTHSQIGTRRYMAPEILQGTINFSNTSFLSMDIYACGLVLWEILTQCTAHDEIEKYKLPFESELGEHPTIEDMRNFVVEKRGRPQLLEVWRQHPSLSYVCDIIEECWDADAEARLSAACVTERFSWHLRSTVKYETKLLYNIA